MKYVICGFPEIAAFWEPKLTSDIRPPDIPTWVCGLQSLVKRTPKIGMLWIIAIVILVVGVAIKMWGVQDIVPAAFETAAAPAPASDESEDIRAYKPQNWCLMAENTVGRFCIEVQKPDQCDPTHRFASRAACEMTPASALPLGISNTGGRFHSPFMQPQRSLATTY